MTDAISHILYASQDGSVYYILFLVANFVETFTVCFPHGCFQCDRKYMYLTCECITEILSFLRNKEMLDISTIKIIYNYFIHLFIYFYGSK